MRALPLEDDEGVHGPGQVEEGPVRPDGVHGPLGDHLRFKGWEELRKPRRNISHSDTVQELDQRSSFVSAYDEDTRE